MKQSEIKKWMVQMEDISRPSENVGILESSGNEARGSHSAVFKAKEYLLNNIINMEDYYQKDIARLQAELAAANDKLKMISSVGFEIVNDDGRLALKGHGTIYMQELVGKEMPK
jgi:uncharacterized protein YydD (DUF2326 family)